MVNKLASQNVIVLLVLLADYGLAITFHQILKKIRDLNQD